MEQTTIKENGYLPDWIEAQMEDVDAGAIMQLRKNDSEYLKAKEERETIEKAYPVIGLLLEGHEEVSLNKEEHNMFKKVLELRDYMEYRERKQYYWYGHMHCYEYMRKLGALKTEQN